MTNKRPLHRLYETIVEPGQVDPDWAEHVTDTFINSPPRYNVFKSEDDYNALTNWLNTRDAVQRIDDSISNNTLASLDDALTYTKNFTNPVYRDNVSKNTIHTRLNKLYDSLTRGKLRSENIEKGLPFLPKNVTPSANFSKGIDAVQDVVKKLT